MLLMLCMYVGYSHIEFLNKKWVSKAVVQYKFEYVVFTWLQWQLCHCNFSKLSHLLTSQELILTSSRQKAVLNMCVCEKIVWHQPFKPILCDLRDVFDKWFYSNNLSPL